MWAASARLSRSIWALAIHPASGEVYIAGQASAANRLGVGGGAQSVKAANNDAFAARIKRELSAVLQSTNPGGAPDATSDGLMLIRAMLGYTGSAVTDGPITGTPPRTAWPLIRQCLNDHCGGHIRTVKYAPQCKPPEQAARRRSVSKFAASKDAVPTIGASKKS